MGANCDHCDRPLRDRWITYLAPVGTMPAGQVITAEKHYHQSCFRRFIQRRKPCPSKI